MNNAFGEEGRKLLPLLQPDDVIWVHDYHLIPLAEELRRVRCNHPIGFFLHTPLPPVEILLSLRERRRQVPGERIGGDERQRAVEILARAGYVAERDEGAGAVEMRLAAQFVAETPARDGGIDRQEMADAMARHPRAFGELATSIVRM